MEEISITRYADDTILLAESSDDLKRLVKGTAFEHQEDKNQGYATLTQTTKAQK